MLGPERHQAAPRPLRLPPHPRRHARERTAGDVNGPVEADPEYQRNIEANNLAAELDDKIGNIHKFTKEKYSVCFTFPPAPM